MSVLQEKAPNLSTLPPLIPQILVVKPDREIAALIKQTLSPHCTITEASNIREAKSLAQIEPFDVAVICQTENTVPIPEVLDLLLLLVDQNREVFVLILSDPLEDDSLRLYRQEGIINQITISSHQNILIHELAETLGINNWKNNLFSAITDNPIDEPSIFSLPLSQSSLPERSSSAPILSQPENQKEVEEESFFGLENIPPQRKITLEKIDLEKEPPARTPTFKSLINPFIQEIAHKIKNPLVSIKTFTELLKSRFNDESFRENFYPTVITEIEKIDQTIESLITYSEQADSNTSKIDFFQILENQTNTFNQETDGKVKIHWPSEIRSSFLISQSQGSYAVDLILSTLRSVFGEHADIEIHIEASLQDRPSNRSPVVLTFALPHAYPGLGQKLEIILAQWIFENLNCQIQEESYGETASLKITLDPSSSVKQGNTLHSDSKIYVDRREHATPISFKDRRKTERRKTMDSISIQDRRWNNPNTLGD